MQRDFIVHTVAEEDVQVQVTGPKGQKLLAKVPGITVEMVDMENGKAHTHTFFDDLAHCRELFVNGQELTLTIQRKSGAKVHSADEVDPEKAAERVNKFRNEAFHDEDKTEEQLADEEKQQEAIKSGKVDPITIPKTPK